MIETKRGLTPTIVTPPTSEGKMLGAAYQQQFEATAMTEGWSKQRVNLQRLWNCNSLRNIKDDCFKCNLSQERRNRTKSFKNLR